MAEISTELKATGRITEGPTPRVLVVVDLGFGTIQLDVEQSALLDEEKVNLLDSALENTYESVLQVLEALAAAADAAEEAQGD